MANVQITGGAVYMIVLRDDPFTDDITFEFACERDLSDSELNDLADALVGMGLQVNSNPADTIDSIQALGPIRSVTIT